MIEYQYAIHELELILRRCGFFEFAARKYLRQRIDYYEHLLNKCIDEEKLLDDPIINSIKDFY